jgi:ATP phosphoribosyltransferase
MYTLYRDSIVAKLLKPRDIPSLVDAGTMDAGFVADEWGLECEANVVNLVEIPNYHVRIATIVEQGAIAPSLSALAASVGERRQLQVASEFPRLTRRSLKSLGIHRHELRAISGSAEAYAPELADVIVDCVESGATVKANGLKFLEVICQCEVHFVANRGYWNCHYAKLAELARTMFEPSCRSKVSAPCGA